MAQERLSRGTGKRDSDGRKWMPREDYNSYPPLSPDTE